MELYLVLSVLASCLLIYIARIVIRNAKCQRFFATKAPHLPVPPIPNIFTGHLYKIVFNPKSCVAVSNYHRKYGDSFGLYYVDRPIIHTKDLDLLKRIYVDDGHKHINKINLPLPLKEFEDSIFHTRDAEWSRARRAFSPSFTPRFISSDEVSGDMERTVANFQAALERKLDEAERATGERSCVIQVDEMVARLALATMFSIGFKQDNIIDFDAPQDVWLKTFSNAVHDSISPLYGAMVMFPVLYPVAKQLYSWSPFGLYRDKLNAFMAQAIKEYRSARKKHELDQPTNNSPNQKFSDVASVGTYRRRFVDMALDAYHDNKVTRDDLFGNMWAFLLAGYLTTADTISAFIWTMAKHPPIQEKLREDILRNGLDSEYLEWCLLEMVRMFPAAPLGSGRELSEDIIVNGKVWPKGALVMPSVVDIHFDSKIWPNPTEYQPDRWKDKGSFSPVQFFGFSLGPRGCPGRHMAMREMKLTVQMILVNYRLQVVENTMEELNFSAPILFVVYLDEPLYIRFVGINRGSS